MSESTVHTIKNYAPLAIAAGAVFAPLCSIMVALRFYARRKHRSGYDMDDWTILGALVFVIGMAVCLFIEIANRSTSPDAEANSLSTNLPEWIFELLQVPALGLVKASFLFLYRRVFATGITKSTRELYWWITGMIALTFAWTIAFLVAFVLVCDSDPSAWWGNETAAEAKCLDTIKLHNAFALSDVVTDLFILGLPIPEIWSLRLPFRSKMAVTGVFLLGGISIVMSAFRAGVYLTADTRNYDPIFDFEFFKTAGVYLTMIEAGLGLTAACLPILWTLVDTSRLYKAARRSLCASSRTSRKRSATNDSEEIPIEPMRSTSITSKEDSYRLNSSRGRTDSEPPETQLFIGPSKEERRRMAPPWGGILVTHSINMTEQKIDLSDRG